MTEAGNIQTEEKKHSVKNTQCKRNLGDSINSVIICIIPRQSILCTINIFFSSSFMGLSYHVQKWLNIS